METQALAPVLPGSLLLMVSEQWIAVWGASAAILLAVVVAELVRVVQLLSAEMHYLKMVNKNVPSADG